MFNRIILVLFLLVGILIGCQRNEADLPLNGYKKIEKALGMDITIPSYSGYEIKYVDIEYPPIVNHHPTGNRHVVHIIYTDKRGKLIELTQEQKERIELGNGREILYGEYEGKPLINLNMSNFKSSLAHSRTKKMEGLQVEYQIMELNMEEKVGFFVFNTGAGSYELTISLTNHMTEADVFQLVENTIVQVKTRSSK